MRFLLRWWRRRRDAKVEEPAPEVPNEVYLSQMRD